MTTLRCLAALLSKPVLVREIRLLAILVSLCTGASAFGETNELQVLRDQVRLLREAFEKSEQEHQRQLRELNSKIEELTRKETAEVEKKKLEQEVAADLAAPGPAAAQPQTPATPSNAWSPASPLQLQSGRAYMDIGLVGTFAVGTSTASDIERGTQLGGHDPNQRGFTVQGVEANFTGAVDPYFRGNANVLWQVDSSGSSAIELEEAWMETLSLPWNLQVRAGQYLTEFGRSNPTHPHAWAFVDSPLVLGRFLGPDGLRNPGVRVSWLAPTAFYSELFLNVQNSQGDTAASFRADSAPLSVSSVPGLPFAYRYNDNNRGVQHVQDMLFAPRYAASVDLSDTQVLLGGVSAAFGPNASGETAAGETSTQVYGVDLFWKWKSARHHGGFPFVSFQTEALARRYEAGAFNWDLNGNGLADPGELTYVSTGLPAQFGGETLLDYGVYSQLVYGFQKGWVAGLRFDYVTGNQGRYESAPLLWNGREIGRDLSRSMRWRLSPNLTWYPSEFSKLRLQYNFDDREGIGIDHSVWFEFEFLLGAHAAHKF